MSRVFIEVFNLSIAASWLIAAVLIVRALITKRMPKWISCCLWALVAIRLLVPFSLESSFSLVPDQQIVIKESVSAQTPEESLPTPPSFEENISSPVETPDYSVQAPVTDNTVSSPEVSMNTDEGNIAIPSVPEINGTVNEGVVNNDTVNGTVDALPNATQDKSESDLSLGKTTASVLGWVWVAGVCAMLSYALISALLLKRRVSLSVPCGENVRKGEAVESPFVFGILRPRIYIPYGLDKVTEECVLAHERAHIKRKDHLIKPFGFLLLSVYWFNPLVWVAYVLLCRDIEYACDEKVINDLAPEARKNYALALLDCAAAHRRIVACPVAFGETGVKERVKNTMKYKKPAFWIILIGIISCIVVGALFLTTSADNDESQNNESSEITEDSEGTSSESELPESSYGKNDLDYIDNLISVERADEETIASLGVYDKYGEEQTNGFLYVFLPKEDVTEFAIHRIDYVDIAADVPVIRIEKTLYTQNELTTKKPLVAMIEMDDILPMNSISFKDKAGNTYYYGIAENNYDGGLWIQRQYLEGTEPSKPEEETEFYVIYANEKRSVPDKYRNLVADLMTSGGWSDFIPEIVPNFIIQIGETKYEYEANVGNISCDGKSKTLTSNEIKELNAVLTEMFSEYLEENGEDLPENSEPEISEPEVSEPEVSEPEISEPEIHVHVYGEWKTVVEPTCKTEGYKERACACGEVDSQRQTIATVGHNYVNNVCSFCGASNETVFVPDYSAGQANTFGNTKGNSQSAAQANWIYYADGRSITKINKTSYSPSKVYSVGSGNVFNINVVGDWIYFYVRESTISNSYIAKVRTDGSRFEKLLVTGETWEMLVVKDTVYYTPVKNPYNDYAKDVAPLYSMSVNGGSVKQIHDGCVSSLAADSSYIYFLYGGRYDEEKTLYRMKHNGSSKIELWINEDGGYKVDANSITVSGSKIYFMDLSKAKYDEGYVLASINTSGGGYTAYSTVDSYSETIFASGNSIYYFGMPCSYGDYAEGRGLVEYNTSSKSYKLIYECEDEMMHSASGLIVLPESYSYVKIYNPAAKSMKSVKIN